MTQNFSAIIRTIIVIIICIFAAITDALGAKTNNYFVGLKIGFNFSRPFFEYPFSDLEHLFKSPKIHYYPSLQIGISNQLKLSTNNAILFDVNYEKKSTYVSDIFPKAGPSIDPFAVKFKYTMISIPVLFKINISSLYFLIGPKLTIIRQSLENFSTVGGFFGYKNVTDKFDKLYYGLETGVGKEITMGSILFSTELRYYFELKPTENIYYPAKNNKFTIHSLYINFGFAYRLF